MIDSKERHLNLKYCLELVQIMGKIAHVRFSFTAVTVRFDQLQMPSLIRLDFKLQIGE
jgi:hypothetical protein